MPNNTRTITGVIAFIVLMLVLVRVAAEASQMHRHEPSGPMLLDQGAEDMGFDMADAAQMCYLR